MTYRGVVRNGLVERDDGASLPDGTLVYGEPADAALPDGPTESAGGGVFSIGRPDLATPTSITTCTVIRRCGMARNEVFLDTSGLVALRPLRVNRLTRTDRLLRVRSCM